MTPLELSGRVRTHVVQDDTLRCALQGRTREAFLALRAEGQKHGFDLHPISSFRDFGAQARIWNHKFRGERPIFDAHGEPLATAAMTPLQIMRAILRWSALPGASRHHWGTDLDVYDAARVPDRKDVQLLPQESAPGGVFHELHLWLDEAMPRFGFFRPYDVYRGGINPEPWHLSFAEQSEPALAALTVDHLRETLESCADSLDHAPLALAALPWIHATFVRNIRSFRAPPDRGSSPIA